MRWVFASLICLLVLSGCSSSGGGDSGPTSSGLSPEDIEQSTGELDVQPTDTTGIILGVVLDPGIRPIPGVTITIQGDSAMTTTSNGDGAFGFEGLAPGTYFMELSKIGYRTVQASADVVAGEANPDIVRVTLQADPTAGPYYRDYVFHGFLACSTRLSVLGFALCSQLQPVTEPALGKDVFLVNYQFERVPDWTQVEMVWQTNQALGDSLDLSVDCFDSTCPEGPTGVGEAHGPSPLAIQINRTLGEQYSYGPGNSSLTIRVFAWGRDDTDVVDDDEVNGQLNSTTGGAVKCVPHPLFPAGTCMRFTGLGVVAQQAFDVYTTIFYGYTPPVDWRFASGAPIPPPPK